MGTRDRDFTAHTIILILSITNIDQLQLRVSFNVHFRLLLYLRFGVVGNRDTLCDSPTGSQTISQAKYVTNAYIQRHPSDKQKKNLSTKYATIHTFEILRTNLNLILCNSSQIIFYTLNNTICQLYKCRNILMSFMVCM